MLANIAVVMSTSAAGSHGSRKELIPRNDLHWLRSGLDRRVTFGLARVLRSGAALTMASTVETTRRPGLTSEEAARRLQRFGPNEIVQVPDHPFVAFLKKFWDPVPWLLEATVVLELVMGKDLEALIIGVLLVFNAALSLFKRKKRRMRSPYCASVFR